MDCYSVKGLSFRYPEAKKQTLNDISFNISQGEFVTVCGLSGCGKSTLLLQLKTCLQPSGERSGEIFFCGSPLADTDTKIQASDIGFVFQSPEHQCVTDKVWHELAFGLESLHMEQGLIRRRVAEMAAFFGMEKWFNCSVNELSGGQRIRFFSQCRRLHGYINMLMAEKKLTLRRCHVLREETGSVHLRRHILLHPFRQRKPYLPQSRLFVCGSFGTGTKRILRTY